MIFNILMPFSRPHNTEALREMWKTACRGQIGESSLLAISHDVEHWRAFGAGLLIDEKDMWQTFEQWDKCYWKLNWGLDIELTQRIPHADWFGFLCDDDTYDPGLFAAVEKAVEIENPEVIVISSHRYDHKETPWCDLIATPENMRRCKVGLEQYFVRADVMTNHRFKNHSQADGELMEILFAKHSEGFKFLPDLFVNFNKLPA
jgi:hypothetical protein